MADFLEERLPIDVRADASFADEFDVDIIATRNGSEYRSLRSNLLRRSFQVRYTLQTADLWARVIALYHRAYGTYAGFRVQSKDDYSTNGNTGTPTATDQALALISAGVYQLQKSYGAGATPLGIGLPMRTLYKPVAGTTKVAVSAVEIASSGWTVDTTTGRVTFAANKTGTITAITKAASAVISIAGHTFVGGESVYISGVAGMTEINGQRALISSVSAGVSITVAINSTAYSTYTSGGVANTRPQGAEPVTGGCQFDIPCRFNSRLDVQHLSPGIRESGSIEIVEILNP
jgi:uncharacterized protein (TIGR02217 family)